MLTRSWLCSGTKWIIPGGRDQPSGDNRSTQFILQSDSAQPLSGLIFVSVIFLLPSFLPRSFICLPIRAYGPCWQSMEEWHAHTINTLLHILALDSFPLARHCYTISWSRGLYRAGCCAGYGRCHVCGIANTGLVTPILVPEGCLLMIHQGQWKHACKMFGIGSFSKWSIRLSQLSLGCVAREVVFGVQPISISGKAWYSTC